MDADQHLIDKLGGPTRVAELLDMAGEPGVVQRISNWKRRGIPAKVLLKHGEVLRQAEAAADATAESPHSGEAA
ncbi:hypothetical protein [Pigmentiphaga sp. CHJ604]|uniref:hypothetical protein n=1 Tax=Pigmentiphaga sp. CHJ604 TaxID=3081984 RepID=UPI0030CCFC7A